MKKKLVFGLLIGFGIFCVLLFSMMLSPLSLKGNSEEVFLYVEQEYTATTINHQLKNQLSPFSYYSVSFLKWLWLNNLKIRDGKYKVNETMNAFDFIRQLRNGKQVVVKLTIIKSRTYSQFESKILESIHISKNELKDVLDSVATLDSGVLNLRPQSFFGIIVPETHLLFWNSSKQVLIRKFKQAYNKFWNESRLSKARKLGMTKYEVVVLASIVEEESANTSEKGNIASVYYNRLRKGMRLQADPTVIFAWQDFTIHRVTNKHLEIISPFNTYKNSGLPPAPICLPSQISVDAVLNMPQTSNLYFCADANFNGKHKFTANYNEHLQNAHDYQAAFKRRFGK